MSIYVNKGRKTIAQVKAETGCTHIINAGFFNMADFTPCGVLIVDGATLLYEWNCEGIGFDKDGVTVGWSNQTRHRNFLWGIPLIVDGQLRTPLSYSSAFGGARPRTAMCVTKDGKVILYCSNSDMSPEGLQLYMQSNGAYSAVMLDGGGSSQAIFKDETVKSSRIVHNFICVWEDTMDTPKKYTVCLDAGHDEKNVNGSPDGTYKEHEFTLDMSKRIQAQLERHGVTVIQTRKDGQAIELADRCKIANDANAALFVSIHSNAVGYGEWNSKSGLCVYTFEAGGERDRAANLLLDRMAETGVKTFGSKLYHARYQVLKDTNMPAYLIEYGFHTNKGDTELLKSTAHRDKLSAATAKAILDYFGIAWIEPITENRIYRVQVGAFSFRANAEKMQAELIAKGYPAIIREETL